MYPDRHLLFCLCVPFSYSIYLSIHNPLGKNHIISCAISHVKSWFWNTLHVMKFHIKFHMCSHILSHVKPWSFGTLHMWWYFTLSFTFEAFSHLKIKFAVPRVRKIPMWNLTLTCLISFSQGKNVHVKIKFAVLHLSHFFHEIMFSHV